MRLGKVMRMNTTLVINSKGGSGKTSITTTVMDYDPQGSSLHWLRVRAGSAARIYGANAAPQRGGRIRSVEMHVPADTQQLIVDAPAGTSGLLLQEMLNRADGILIPVAPSAIDIHATANFVRDLLLVGRIRTRNIQLAVVANRVRSSMPVYQPLERFLNSLGLPFLTRISDSDVYVKAAESGIGIFEMASSAAAAECSEFMPIVDWVGRQRDSVVSGDGKVIDLASRRWMERTPGLSSIGSRS